MVSVLKEGNDWAYSLRKIYDKGYTNFYLTIISNKIKTLLYSGTFSFFENIVFTNDTNNIISASNTIAPPSSNQTTSSTSTSTTNVEWPKAGKTVIIYTKFKNTTV